MLRDKFEMFTVSQLHNAFWVVVQLERHCWLSLAAGIFLHHIERCCQKSVLLKTLQAPANKSPPPPTPPHPLSSQRSQSGARSQKGSTGSVALLQACPLWKSPHASAGLSVGGVMGSPLGPGVCKHTWPKTNFHNSGRCANRRPQKYPENSDHAKIILLPLMNSYERRRKDRPIQGVELLSADRPR